MATSESVDWDVCERCEKEGGIGVRLPDSRNCWKHADAQELAAALKRLGEDGSIDARGVTVGAGLLRRILAAAPLEGTESEGGPRLQSARFNHATFTEEATFHLGKFKGTRFHGPAGFGATTFQGGARFDWAQFMDEADFKGATFHGNATFARARFQNVAWFSRATFESEARFDEALFRRELGFYGVTFKHARRLGPILGMAHVSFDDAMFDQRIHIEVASRSLSCRSARFPNGVQFGLRWAGVVLDDADFGEASILAGVPPFRAGEWSGGEIPDGSEIEDVSEVAEGWVRETAEGHGPPRQEESQPWVASLCRANVGNLTIANAALQWCLLTGAHNLDRLRLESASTFPATPDWQVGWKWPWTRRHTLAKEQVGWNWPWTRRHTLAEEQFWRVIHESGIRRKGWYGEIDSPVVQAQNDVNRLGHSRIMSGRRGQPGRTNEVRQAWARENAGLYRALRKGREENKDEPGAADFYYGEMEMRRNAAARFSVERTLLTLYWLVSGYALRAWRALAAALIAIVVGSLLLVGVGFQARTAAQPAPTRSAGQSTPAAAAPAGPSLADAMLYSVRTAVGLPQDPRLSLNRWGGVVQVGLRITLPVLLGLAVLSIRGRVKR